MRRSGFAVLVVLLLLLTQVVQAAPAPAPAAAQHVDLGEAPPPEQGANGSISIESYTPGDQIAESDEEFVADTYPSLDTYTFRSGSPIQFPIRITRYFGPVDGDGHLLHPENIEDQKALLTLRVWDVDQDYAGGDVAPEVDKVSINGNQALLGTLTGSNGQWSTFTVEVPVSLLRFPSYAEGQGVQPAENTVSIDIDTANVGVCECWAVTVDWGRLVIKGVRPALLLHGFMSSASTWETWISIYGPDAGLPVRARSFENNHGSWLAHASQEAAFVEETKQLFGVKKLNLVGHSKGGLDSRAYLSLGGDDVGKLVMLGTPNGGSPLADIVKAGGILNLWVGLVSLIGEPALTELTQPYMRLIGNRIVGPNPNTRYYTVAGNWKGLAGFSNPLIWGDDDGVVAVSSVEILPYTSSLGHTSSFHTAMTSGQAEFNMAKGQIAVPMSLAGPEAESPIDLTSLVAYTAGPDSTASVTVAAGTPATLGILWGSGDLSLTITAPSGQTLTGPGPGVEMTRSTDPAVGISSVLYRLTTPESGIYTLNVKSAGGNVDYLAVGAVEGGPKLTVAPQSGFVPSGDNAVLTASVAWNGAQAIPLHVTAKVQQPGGQVDEVLLQDDGSGTYAGTYQPLGEGYYAVAVVAEAADPAQAFSRIGNTAFTVVGGSDRFTGSYSHNGVDLNGDGLFDQLRVQAGVTVAQTGDYLVTGELSDTSGTTIVRTGRLASLGSGAANVALSFDGTALGRSGFSGDLILTGLALVRADGSVADFKAPATTISSYSSRQFQRPAITALPGITDMGVDTDGDGLYNQLRITVPVDVLTAGSYDFNARLMDSQNTELGWFGGSAYLPAGQSTITLSYSGKAIGENGMDGPYYVRDFSMYGYGNRGINVYDLYTTQAYAVNQFQGFAATFVSVKAKIADLRGAGLIDNDGIAQSLTAKVEAAEAAAARGENEAARNVLGALINDLKAQTGKHVSEVAADQLSKLVAALLKRLP
jgi:pimeloyl-ACP methyl ester carboxylesterase